MVSRSCTRNHPVDLYAGLAGFICCVMKMKISLSMKYYSIGEVEVELTNQDLIFQQKHITSFSCLPGNPSKKDSFLREGPPPQEPVFWEIF